METVRNATKKEINKKHSINNLNDRGHGRVENTSNEKPNIKFTKRQKINTLSSMT